jgi:hypothetical protein
VDVRDEQPVPPITLRDGWNVDVFADVESAVNNMDLDDVREGRTAFDSVGSPLRIVDNGDWPIDLVVDENADPIPEDLELWLRTVLRDLGPDWVGLPDFESAPLATLLVALLRFQVGVPYERRLMRLSGHLRGRDGAASRPAG